MKFTERLLKVCQQKNISLTKLSKETEISIKTIKNWLNLKSVAKCKHLINLCKYLKVSADYLLGLEDETGAKIDIEL